MTTSYHYGTSSLLHCPTTKTNLIKDQNSAISENLEIGNFWKEFSKNEVIFSDIQKLAKATNALLNVLIASRFRFNEHSDYIISIIKLYNLEMLAMDIIVQTGLLVKISS